MKNSDRVGAGTLSDYVQNNLDIEKPDTVVNELHGKIRIRKRHSSYILKFSKTLKNSR